MNKALILPLLLLAGAAQAGVYSVQQESDCPLVSKTDLGSAVRKAGTATGLDLPKDMALRTEVRCAQDGKTARYLYTIRTSIEKQVSDGEQLRWTPVAHNTTYGTVSGSTQMLRQVHFTVRDVVRQEP